MPPAAFPWTPPARRRTLRGRSEGRGAVPGPRQDRAWRGGAGRLLSLLEGPQERSPPRFIESRDARRTLRVGGPGPPRAAASPRGPPPHPGTPGKGRRSRPGTSLQYTLRSRGVAKAGAPCHRTRGAGSSVDEHAWTSTRSVGGAQPSVARRRTWEAGVGRRGAEPKVRAERPDWEPFRPAGRGNAGKRWKRHSSRGAASLRIRPLRCLEILTKIMGRQGFETNLSGPLESLKTTGPEWGMDNWSHGPLPQNF